MQRLGQGAGVTLSMIRSVHPDDLHVPATMSASSTTAPPTLPAALQRWWCEARAVLVLSGAGMSAESGIGTFREAQTGLWARYDPMTLATLDAFDEDPALVWGWYCWRMARVHEAVPNAGHQALARLGAARADWRIVTQNVDDLHERAGSTDVVHLHGALHALRCRQCDAPYAGAVDLSTPASSSDAPQRRAPPSCPHCGGPIRPGVVWFGEALPAQAWQQAVEAAQRADLVLVVGTSGLVTPAASLPGIARTCGARVVEVNPAPTALSDDMDLCWRTTAAAGLPLLLEDL